MWIPAIASLVSGTLSYFGQKANQKEQEDELEQRKKKLLELLEDETTTNENAAKVKASANASMVEVANRFAVGNRGAFNTSQALAGTVAPVAMEGAKNELLIREGAKNRNANILSQIAGMSSPDGVDFTNVVSDAIGGLQVGMEMEDLLKSNNNLTDPDKEVKGTSQSTLEGDQFNILDIGKRKKLSLDNLVKDLYDPGNFGSVFDWRF